MSFGHVSVFGTTTLVSVSIPADKALSFPLLPSIYSGLNHLVTITRANIPNANVTTPPMTPPMIAGLLILFLLTGVAVAVGVSVLTLVEDAVLEEACEVDETAN